MLNRTSLEKKATIKHAAFKLMHQVQNQISYKIVKLLSCLINLKEI